MSISTRIKQLCDHEGSQSRFARKTGMKTQTVSRMVQDGAGVRSDTLETIHKVYPTLNIHWLITGQGQVFFDEPLEPEIIDNPAHLRIINLQEKRINELEREIMRVDPGLAERLGIEK